MSTQFLEKRLAPFRRRPVEWMGILQRIFREFAEAAETKLTDDELDQFLGIPDRLGALGQAGILLAVELAAGRDGVRVSLDPDPNAVEDLKLTHLSLCDLAGPCIEVRLIVADRTIAAALGIRAVVTCSPSPHLAVAVMLAPQPTTERAAGSVVLQGPVSARKSA